MTSASVSPAHKRPKTASERSVARYARAARVLPPVTLDAARAATLGAILERTGESYAGWVRRQIDEAPISRDRKTFSAKTRRQTGKSARRPDPRSSPYFRHL